VIGAVDRDEGLRVASCVEDPLRVVDLHGLVGGRVQHQQRRAEPPDVVGLGLGGDVVEELPADTEGPPGQAHFGLTALVDVRVPSRNR
jgi:hypothetical protein